jgi:hypothetical protein
MKNYSTSDWFFVRPYMLVGEDEERCTVACIRSQYTVAQAQRITYVKDKIEFLSDSRGNIPEDGLEPADVIELSVEGNFVGEGGIEIHECFDVEQSAWDIHLIV